MASITFIDYTTVVPADWLNAVDGVVWTLFNGSSSASDARTALGLNTMATQSSSSVSITGGTISGVTLTSPTITGGTLTTGTIVRPSLQSPNEVITTASGSGTVSINCDTAAYHGITITGNITTLSISNIPASPALFSLTLELIQGGSGGYTVTWPGAVKWPGGISPVLSTTVGKIDVVTLITRNGGTSWLGFIAGQNL